MNALVAALIRLLLPKAPEWASILIAEVIPAVIDVVSVVSQSDKKGRAKRALIVKEIGDAFDEALDVVPEWSELSEDKRDLILSGLVELILFIDKVVSNHGKKKARKLVRSAMAQAARQSVNASDKPSLLPGE